MSGWIGVVPGSEVPVEGRDDGVLLPFLYVLPEGRHTHSVFESFEYYMKKAKTNKKTQTCPTVQCTARRHLPVLRRRHLAGSWPGRALTLAYGRPGQNCVKVTVSLEIGYRRLSKRCDRFDLRSHPSRWWRGSAPTPG